MKQMKQKKPKPNSKTEQVVYGRDGRKMNPNSLKNWDMKNPPIGFQTHPENINPNKTNQFTERSPIKKALLEVLRTPVNSKEDKTKMQAVLRLHGKVCCRSAY